MPKVSVIIPVYNTEPYLRKCLDSVCGQTLTDIEIICINDCSPDDSLAILKEYAARDPRIKIIDFPENRGAAVARNAGIDVAQGDYLGFVDSDDFIDFDFYENLYHAAITADADCAKGNYKDAQTGHVDYTLNERIRKDKNNFAFAYCSAIFKRMILNDNHIRFPSLCDMEDPVFTFQFALSVQKIVIVDDAFINIVSRADSLTRRPLKEFQINDKFAGFNKIVELANAAHLQEETYALVISFWLWQTYQSKIQTDDLNLRKHIAELLLKTWNYVLCKNSVLDQVAKQSNLCAKYLALEDAEKLQHFSTQEDYRQSIFEKLRNRMQANHA